VVLQWCYSGVTVVLQWWYGGVLLVSQWWYGGATVVLWNHSSRERGTEQALVGDMVVGGGDGDGDNGWWWR
jgi:hypothetical protein